MKKIGIVLAALVIATFMVGTAAALNRIPVPQQEEYFTEKSSVQGTGMFLITKKVLDKDIAIDVEERIEGNTGLNGTFAMESKEFLNESVDRCRQDGEMEFDPLGLCGHVLITPPTGNHTNSNYYHRKMIQYEGDPIDPTAVMQGLERYASPSFHGGTGASVEEYFAVQALQKQEEVHIDTTNPVGEKQALNFDTMDMFKGMWGTESVWKKPCKKEITHSQQFIGDFAVQKNLIFEEDVVPCSGKKDC